MSTSSTTQISRPPAPKTPIITGAICGICITLAWSISFGSWLLKKYRRHKQRKQRRSRSVVAGPPYDHSTTASRGRYGGSVVNRPALFISQPTHTESTKETSPEDSKSPDSIPPISSTGPRGAREVTSWIPESEWGKSSHPSPRHHHHHSSSAHANLNNSSHPARQPDTNNNNNDEKNNDGEAYALPELSDYARGAPYGQDQDEGRFHLSTLVLPPSPGRGQHDPNGDYFSSQIPQ